MANKSIRKNSKKNKTKKNKRSSIKRSSTKRIGSTRSSTKRIGSKRSSSKRSRNINKRKHKRNPSHIHSDYMMHGGRAQSPWVGSPYIATDRIPNGNFLPQSLNGVPSGLPVPPRQSGLQFGGRNNKKNNNKNQRGGGISSFISSILPDEVVNFGRYIPAAAGNLMDRYNGLETLPSSSVYPTEQPLVQKLIQTNNSISPPNINAAYTQALGGVQ